MNGWRDTWLETADALPSLVAKLQYARGATDVQRVSQLDADVFDAELMSLLQLQLNKMFAFKVRLSGLAALCTARCVAQALHGYAL